MNFKTALVVVAAAALTLGACGTASEDGACQDNCVSFG